MKKNKKAFSLIELLVVIAIIIILSFSTSSLFFHNSKDKEELNKKVISIINEIEEINYNNLLGKTIKNFKIPKKRKITFQTGSKNSLIIKKYYLTGTTWEEIKTKKIERKGFLVNNFYCVELLDQTSSGSFNGIGEIIFDNKNIYLSGGDCNDIKYQKLKIDLQLRHFKKNIIFNTLNGVTTTN